jgi:hypothetical protein
MPPGYLYGVGFYIRKKYRKMALPFLKELGTITYI